MNPSPTGEKPTERGGEDWGITPKGREESVLDWCKGGKGGVVTANK